MDKKPKRKKRKKGDTFYWGHSYHSWGYHGGDPLSNADLDLDALGGDERTEALHHCKIYTPQEYRDRLKK